MGTAWDTVLALRTGCPPAGEQIACDDDIGGGVLQTTLTRALGARETVYVVVDGFSGAGGDFVLTVSPPVQDGDGDGVADADDNCPGVANPDQANWNRDAEGDACDDSDNDGVFDATDNCRTVANPDQANWNRDGEGDACDDSDTDGVVDATDNCRTMSNARQTDADEDGVGDACDNCPQNANADQADDDRDGLGNACDGIRCREDTECTEPQTCQGDSMETGPTT